MTSSQVEFLSDMCCTTWLQQLKGAQCRSCICSNTEHAGTYARKNYPYKEGHGEIQICHACHGFHKSSSETNTFVRPRFESKIGLPLWRFANLRCRSTRRHARVRSSQGMRHDWFGRRLEQRQKCRGRMPKDVIIPPSSRTDGRIQGSPSKRQALKNVTARTAPVQPPLLLATGSIGGLI